MSISIIDFKKLKVHEFKRLKSCEVFADGQYLFSFVNACNDYIRTQVEGFAELSNTQGGETLEQITKQEVAV